MLSKASKLVLGVVLCLAFARQAQAPIYTWRDASGTLVLSSHELESIERTPTESNA